MNLRHAAPSPTACTIASRLLSGEKVQKAPAHTLNVMAYVGSNNSPVIPSEALAEPR